MFMGLLGNDNPIFKADNIPFLASDFSSAKYLWDASRPSIEKALEENGLKLLYAVPWPPQGFYTKKPISSAADLEGLKMRAYSPTTSRLAVLLKATPTTVQTPESPSYWSHVVCNGHLRHIKCKVSCDWLISYLTIYLGVFVDWSMVFIIF